MRRLLAMVCQVVGQVRSSVGKARGARLCSQLALVLAIVALGKAEAQSPNSMTYEHVANWVRSAVPPGLAGQSRGPYRKGAVSATVILPKELGEESRSDLFNLSSEAVSALT